MPRKSDGEKIDELGTTVARITERLEAVLRSLDKLLSSQKEAEVAAHDLRRTVELELALFKRDLEDLKKWKEEQKREREDGSRRAWAFGPNVLGAVVNVLLSAVVAYFVSRR